MLSNSESGLGADELPFGPSGLGVGGAFALVCLLEDAVRFGHEMLQDRRGSYASTAAIQWESLKLPIPADFEKTDGRGRVGLS